MEEETTKQETEIQTPVKVDPFIEEMANAGLLFGRKKSKTNPKMRKYIFANRNGFELFDLEKTAGKLDEAKKFLVDVSKKGKKILFVGTTPASSSITRAIADEFAFPFVIHRWLGGTLTNFETINTRLKYYLTLKSDEKSGRLEKYTKKERTKFSKELERLETLFGGLEKLDNLPGAVVLANSRAHSVAVKEARVAGIPIVAVVSSDSDPDAVDYPIPANDNSRSSVEWIFNQIADAIRKEKE